MKIKVNVRAALFKFDTFQEWGVCASMWFRREHPILEETITVDREGSICTRVVQFSEAAFPITVYGIGEPGVGVY